MKDIEISKDWLDGKISLEKLAELAEVNLFEIYAQLSDGEPPSTAEDVCKAIEAARRP